MGRPDDDSPRRRRRWVVPALGATAVLLLAAAAVGAISTQSVAPGTVVDMRGNRVAPDLDATPDPSVESAMNVTDRDAGDRLQVPAVGLDVPLGALDTVDGVIQPPGFTSAYRVRNKGVSLDHADQGTVFVVMHSLRHGGTAPGNYLIDVAAGTSKVAVGADVLVGGVRYAVTGSFPVQKTGLAADAEVWENTPNRLVLITCLQVPARTESTDNLVITAVRQP